MKKIVFLLVFLLVSAGISAQGPIIPQREVIVVDNFTSVPNITLGLYQYARQSVLDGLSRRRVDVIDVEEEGFGRADIVYPSLNFAASNSSRPFDVNRMARILNDYPQARYYLTAYICRFDCRPVEHARKDKDGNPVVKTDFTAEVDLEVYIYDVEAQTSEGPLRWKSNYSGAATPEYAERYAVSNLSSQARTFVGNRFRYKASVIKLGDYNRRGKLQNLFLSCGSDIDVARGDIFHIYSVTDIGGIESARKLGRVKVREVTGRESCHCSISTGETEINNAFLAGETLVAISDHDGWF